MSLQMMERRAGTLQARRDNRRYVREDSTASDGRYRSRMIVRCALQDWFGRSREPYQGPISPLILSSTGTSS